MNERQRAKPMDTPTRQARRAVAMLAEHAEGVLALTVSRGVVSVYGSGEPNVIAALGQIAGNFSAPSDRQNFSVQISPPPPMPPDQTEGE